MRQPYRIPLDGNVATDTSAVPSRRDTLRSLGETGLLVGLAAGSVLALAGCGSDPKTATTAKIDVQAAPTLNPDLNGRPSPVVVRVYQLLSAEMFENADFFQLFEQEKAALGPTSAGKDEVVLEPGQITKLTIGVKDQVKALGVVVAFRNFEKATWRAVAKVNPDVVNYYKLQALSQIVNLSWTGDSKS